jgi:toxin ParE1/3/4
MSRYIVATAARHDIDSILLWSYENFGEQARLRYAALLAQPFFLVAEGPQRAGTVHRDEIAPGARTYHLLHARNHVGPSSGRVKQPRHLLLFRLRADGCMEILRVLHDSMELIRHLPDEYRAEPPGDTESEL